MFLSDAPLRQKRCKDVVQMKRYLTGFIRLGVFALVLFVLHGCAGMSPEEQEAKRSELDKMGEETIAALLEKHPEAQEALELSVGYVVIKMAATKIPVIGAGGGSGVILDKRSGRKSYIKVSQFELGGGLGAQKYKVIVFFEKEKLLDRAIKGEWHFEAGAEAAAGEGCGGGTGEHRGAIEGTRRTSPSMERVLHRCEADRARTR